MESELTLYGKWTAAASEGNAGCKSEVTGSAFYLGLIFIMLLLPACRFARRMRREK